MDTPTEIELLRPEDINHRHDAWNQLQSIGEDSIWMHPYQYGQITPGELSPDMPIMRTPAEEGFRAVTIRQLARTARFAEKRIKRGTVLTLDTPTPELLTADHDPSINNIFCIRKTIFSGTFGQPSLFSYAFSSEHFDAREPIDDISINTLVKEGLYKYLTGEEQDQAASDAILENLGNLAKVRQESQNH